MLRVVAGGETDVEYFFEGVPAGFAVLQLDQVEHFVLTLQHQVVKPQQYGRPLSCRTRRPLRLYRTGALCGRDDVFG